jgi:hypothetical protein
MIVLLSVLRIHDLYPGDGWRALWSVLFWLALFFPLTGLVILIARWRVLTYQERKKLIVLILTL